MLNPLFRTTAFRLLSLWMSAASIATTLVISSATLASGDHAHDAGHHDQEPLAQEGPHGGKLLSDGDFSVEITVFETGVEPEMRLYFYADKTPISTDSVDVSVVLDRLGGVQDLLSFYREQDYWVSDQIIREPHSYDVTVEITWQNRNMRWQYASHEGRSQLTERHQKQAQIRTEIAAKQTLEFTNTLFGVIETPENQIFNISAPYAGIVTKIHVNTGDKVKRGQTLLTIRNRSTLQDYSVKSPTDGEVSERLVNQGARADEQVLMSISDLSNVWVEMSAFPEDIEQLAIGQTVTVTDMHDHDQAQGKIEYIAPQMTAGHIARARVTIANPEGHWRPGMHVEASIATETVDAALAVEKIALQTFRDMDVVFAKYGNTFEVRMLELGKDDGRYVEVLSGLEPGTVYVTQNSYLLKADALKDGASHDH